MSWTILPVSAQDVRDYLNLEGSSGRYSDAILGSNIRAAASFIQRETSRQFEPQTGVTKKFTTEGRGSIAIPDLRTATSITLQDSALEADASYYLVPDAVQSGVYTGVQFRAYGRDSYLSNPQWFDRNLDTYERRGYSYASLPNDLAITGDWGHSPYPDDFLHAVKVLAAFYTKRPASVLADVQVTPEGNELRYSQYPTEVRQFIHAWSAGTQLVSIG